MQSLIKYSILLTLFTSILLVSFGQENTLPVQTQNFDFNWKFLGEDIENGGSLELDDKHWRSLDLPHDWSVEGEYSAENGDWQTGFLPAGVGWYRKSFKLDPNWKNKRIKIHFEGVYLNSDVYINGNHLGHRPNGYIGFEYDLTEYLKKGENVIAVRVDHSNGLTGRWYTGSGIYRHVWLKAKNPIHIKNWGVSFTTPNISKQRADVEMKVKVENEGDVSAEVRVKTSLIDRNGAELPLKEVLINSIPDSTVLVSHTTEVLNPQLWSPSNPYLYTLRTEIYKNNELIDCSELSVGFRIIEFRADFGFKLNDSIIKLKGVCDHHTAGAVGAAVPDDMLYYRLKLLKEMGCNAIRTAHNPFSPTFYKICDEMGIMVMNEFLDGWDVPKAEHDYGLYFENWWRNDAKDFIERDRNHPSVIIWSIGNEVRMGTSETQKSLIDFFHELDQTRPVTQGGDSPSRSGNEDELKNYVDLIGFNGKGEIRNVFEKYHEKNPQHIIVGTEVPHTYQTRGVYRTKTHWRVKDFPAIWEIKNGNAGKIESLSGKNYPIPDLTEKEVFPEEIQTKYYKNGVYYPIENNSPWAKHLYYQSSYDNATVRAGVRKTWQRVRDLPYVIGQFRWGSFDYLGETNNWPSRFCNFGVIDVCGFPKDHYYLYQSLWTEKPMVHILPHWTHSGKEGVIIPVVAYTNCEEVELFLNGKSLGIQRYDDEQLVWHVLYEEGTIVAVGKNKGKVVCKSEQQTAGDAKKINLSIDRAEIRANKRDVVHITVDIQDENNTFCPHAENLLEFEIEGPGKIIGIDNGDPLDLSSYKTNRRKAFRGKVMLLIQSTAEKGDIAVRVEGKGLSSDNIWIQAE